MTIVVYLLLIPVAESAVISSVQSGTATSSGNGIVTVPITAVNPARSFLIFNSRHDLDRPPGSMIRGRLNGAGTAVEFERVTDETSTMEIRWYVAEFFSGVTVQRGEVDQTAATVNVGITAVGSLGQAFVTWSKTPDAPDGIWNDDDPALCDLTSTTNLQCRAGNANAAHRIAWQVINFTNAADINVQRGTVANPYASGSGTVETITIPSAVNVNNTMVLTGYTVTDGGGNDVGSRMLRAVLTNSTTITVDRSIDSGNNIGEITWQAIEFLDGTTVQRGSTNFIAPTGTPGVMSWTHNGSLRNAHSAISVAASGGAISVVRSGQGTSAGTNLTTVTISPASSNKLIVGIAIEEDNCDTTTDEDIASATYSGAAMTFITGSRVTVPATGLCMKTELWYRDNPSAGTNQVRIQTQGNVRDLNVIALMLNNAAAGQPENVAINSNVGVAAISTNINTLTNGAMLVDIVGNGGTGNYTATSGPSQIEQQEVDGSTSTASLSTKIIAVAPTPGELTKNIVITSVDTARSVAFAAVQPGGGQNMGRSDFNTDDIIGTGSYTLSLTSPTQLTITRTNNNANSDVGWFVVEFNDVQPLFLEVDSVTLNDTTVTPTFTSVTFRQTYPVVPLVFPLPTNEGTDPAALRVRNVTTTGFEIAQVEPETLDGTHIPMTVDYIVVTPGVQTLPDGRTIEAGTHSTQTIQHGAGVPGGEGWDTVNFTTTFASTPSVLLQIQGLVNETSNPPATTSIPWLTASIQNVGTTSFQTALERSEVNDGGTISSNETIAYLAIQGGVQGSFVAEGKTILYESINSADNIQGWDNENCAGNVGQAVSFVNVYTSIPIAVAHTSRHDGGDGGWIRRCNITTTQIFLAYDEDQFRDTERNHTAEAASVLVFSEAFCIPNCVAVVVHHYAISHPGTGVTCLPVDVTITAHDIADIAVDPGTATITLTTTTGKGDWTTVTAGTGTLNNGAQGDGTATYQFPGGESSVTLALNYTDIGAGNSELFNIDVTDGTATDKRNNLDPEDLDITFSQTGFRFFNVTDGNAVITTQLSAKPSDTGFNSKTFALQAIRASDSDPSVCTAAFPDGADRVIDLGAECRSPTICAGRQVSIVNNSITTAIDTNNDNGGGATSSYTPTTLRFTDSGSGFTHAVFSLTYPDAGLMQLHAQFEIPLDDGSPSGDFMAGASNDFVVRPFGFSSVIQDAGGGANPGANTPGGTIFTTAGDDFRAIVAAFVWEAIDDNGGTCDLTVDPGCLADDGIPDTNADLLNNNGGFPNSITLNFQGAGAIDTTLNTVTPFEPNAGVLGQLLDSGTGVAPVVPAASFATGIATITTIYYTEVGSMTVNAQATNYLGSGQDILGRTSNLAVNPNNGAVGRFISDRFTATDNTPDFIDECTAGANPFTYLDQTFYYGTAPVLTVTALNSRGAITQNYGGGTAGPGGYWKLTSTLPRTYTDQAGAAAIFNELQDTDVTLGGHIDYDGTGTLALDNGSAGDAFMYTRVSEEGEFSANVDLSFTAAGLTDSDGVCFDPDDNGVCDAYTSITGMGGAILRFGRLNIGTAFGSELLPLPVPLHSEYFDGVTGSFVLNPDDDCTALVVTDLSLTSAVEGPETDGDVVISSGGSCPGPGNGCTTASITNNPFAGGDGDLNFSAPGTTNTGYSDITVDLSNIPLGPHPDMTWLRYDWDGDGNFDNDPVGRVTFGIYGGFNEFIYIREPW